ncbi:117aa long hypothetical protein [Pyrococcus horikoshii OT3]|uniref:Uncharacterized protein n=1 Tax=Pyrococcus horikoshii (strain ATCC 700860 / DSM 12428 / JCM 9974 / NBRC 100139 / OT-3) TaxID=70601 RepID=O59392_PYRHO|nr:117aa long hypothetical protein [Pyrococcus horikoshii OT3]
MTPAMPKAFKARAADSLEEPMPKFLPATTTSPGLTFLAKSGLTSIKAIFASSFGSFVKLYLPGVISSVDMSSPNFQTFPVVIILLPPDSLSHHKGHLQRPLRDSPSKFQQLENPFYL